MLRTPQYNRVPAVSDAEVALTSAIRCAQEGADGGEDREATFGALLALDPSRPCALTTSTLLVQMLP